MKRLIAVVLFFSAGIIGAEPRLYKAVEIDKKSAIYDLYFQDDLTPSVGGEPVTVDVSIIRFNLNDLYNQINILDKQILDVEAEKGRIQQKIDEILKVAS